MIDQDRYRELEKKVTQLERLLGRIHAATKAYYKEKAVVSPRFTGFYGQVVDAYHKHLPKLPKIRALTTKRKSLIRARCADSLTHIEDWEKYFKDAAKREFLHGKNDRAWFADIDFLLREDVVVKMQEGKYD